MAKEGRTPPRQDFGKVMFVFKGALARPIIYLFTGKLRHLFGFSSF
jgi:hypothetical protein